MIIQLINTAIIIFFFLFPIFFLPATAEFYEYNKMALLILSSLVLLLLFSFQIAKARKIIIYKSTFGFPLFFLAGIMLVSTLIQSPNPVVSLTTPLSVTTIIAGVLLYFLLINIDKQEHRRNFVSEGLPEESPQKNQLMNILILDATTLSLYTIGLFLGILPQSRFTPAGTLLATAMFLSVIAVYLVIKMIFYLLKITLKTQYEQAFREQGKISEDRRRDLEPTNRTNKTGPTESDLKTTHCETSLLYEQENFVCEQKVKDDQTDELSSTLIFYLLSLFLILSAFILLIYHLTTDQKALLLPFSFGWVIFLEVIKNIKTLLWGVGPANFITAFTLAKPLAINNTPYWTFIFTSSSSFLLTLATESGILAACLYLVIFFKSIKLLFRKIQFNNKQAFDEHDKIFEDRMLEADDANEEIKSIENKEAKPKMPILKTELNAKRIALAKSGYFAQDSYNHDRPLESEKFGIEDLPKLEFILPLILALLLQIFLPSNMTLFILTIILLAFASDKKIAWQIDLKKLGILAYTLTLPVIIAVSVVLFFATKYYLADVYFKFSLDDLLNNRGSSAYQKQFQAITLNPTMDRYHIAYSQTSLNIANALASKSKLTDEDKQNIPKLVQQSINEARTAVNLYRTNIVNWDNLARIYAALGNFAQGSIEWAKETYRQKTYLDPVSPQNYFFLGQIFYTQKQYKDAEENFRQAANLKTDYANARYYLGLTLTEEKKYPEAYREIQTAKAFIQKDSPDMAKLDEQLNKLLKLIPAQAATFSAQPQPQTETQTLEAIPTSFQNLPTVIPSISLSKP